MQEGFHRFMHDPPVPLAPFLHHGRLFLTHPEYADLYRRWLRNNMAKHAIWKHPKFLYGHEMLLLAPSDETAMQRTGFKAILDEESEFFKSRWG